MRSDSSAHDREVFLSSWQLVFGVLARLLEIPLDLQLFARVLQGMRNLAFLAAHFRVPDALECTVRGSQSIGNRPLEVC